MFVWGAKERNFGFGFYAKAKNGLWIWFSPNSTFPKDYGFPRLEGAVKNYLFSKWKEGGKFST